MKKILATLLALGVLCGACQADVLIYKMKVIGTVTGNGQVQKIAVSGFYIIDPASLKIAIVSVERAHDQFQIFEFTTNATFGVADAGLGKKIQAISVPGNGIAGAVFFVGTISPTPLLTGTVTQYEWPKTAKLTGSEIYSSFTQIEQDSGSAIYDQIDTQTENGLGGNFDSTVSDAEQTLLNAGLTELPPVLE